MFTLRSPVWEADIAPRRGGLIAALRSGGVDVLAPETVWHSTLDGLPLFGCFAMLPFANRLSPPRLPTATGAVRIPVNWPSEQAAIHGTAWHQSWRVEHLETAQIRLSVRLEAEGQPLGVGNLALRLTGTVRMELTFLCLHPDGLAAGIGLHPWFACPAGGTVRFQSGPPGEIGFAPPGGARARRVLASDLDAGRDACFPDWSGRAILTAPHLPRALRLRADAPFLHVFMASAYRAICLEPVTQFPNAQQIAPGSVDLLRCGESRSLTVRLDWVGPPTAERTS